MIFVAHINRMAIPSMAANNKMILKNISKSSPSALDISSIVSSIAKKKREGSVMGPSRNAYWTGTHESNLIQVF